MVVNISPYEASGVAPSLKVAAVKAGFLALMNEVAVAFPDVRVNTICPLVTRGVANGSASGGRKPINAGIADLTKYLTSVEAPYMSSQVLNAQVRCYLHFRDLKCF